MRTCKYVSLNFKIVLRTINSNTTSKVLYRFLTEEMIKDYEKRCLKDIEKEKDDN